MTLRELEGAHRATGDPSPVPATWMSIVDSRIQVDGLPGTGTIWLRGEDLIWTMQKDDTLLTQTVPVSNTRPGSPALHANGLGAGPTLPPLLSLPGRPSSIFDMPRLISPGLSSQTLLWSPSHGGPHPALLVLFLHHTGTEVHTWKACSLTILTVRTPP